MRADGEPDPLTVGQMLDDKYRIDELLEVGGMGAVYVGSHTKLEKRVAIKVLRSELSCAQDIVERFLREAVAASRIGHENIVEVTDTGKARNQAPFVVMELLEGENLARRIQRLGPLPVPEACHVAVEILSAMDAAHRAGIVHGDLKPENVFLVPRSRGESVKILDFGIWRMARTEKGYNRLTLTGLVMGTPHYMSPEQAYREGAITPAADLYAVGVMLHQMLTAKVPFDGTDHNSLIFKALSGQFLPPGTHVALPQRLEGHVYHAMARKPEERFASANEMALALEPFLPATAEPRSFPRVQSSPAPAGDMAADRESTPSPTMALACTGSVEFGQVTSLVARETDAGPEPDRDSNRTSAADTSQPTRRRRSTASFAAIAVVVLLGTGAGIALRRGFGDDQTTPRPDSAPAVRAAAAPRRAAATPQLPPPDAEARSGWPAVIAASAVPAREAKDPAAEPPAAEPVTVTFVVSPADATIRIDGNRIDGHRVTAPRASPEFLVEVSREGYVSEQRMVSFAFDREVEIILARKPGAVRRATGRRHRPARPAAETGGGRIITDSPYD